MNIELQLVKIFRGAGKDVVFNWYKLILEKRTRSLSVEFYSNSSFMPTPKDLVLVEHKVTNNDVEATRSMNPAIPMKLLISYQKHY